MKFLRISTVVLLLVSLVAGCSKLGIVGFQPWDGGGSRTDRYTFSKHEFKPQKWGCGQTDAFHAMVTAERNIKEKQGGTAIKVPMDDYLFSRVWAPKIYSVKRPGCVEDPFYTTSVQLIARDGASDGFYGTIAVRSESYGSKKKLQAKALNEYADCEVSGRFKVCQGEHVDGMWGTYPAEFIILSEGDNTLPTGELFFAQCSSKWDQCLITRSYRNGVSLWMRYPNTYRDFESIYKRYQSLVTQADSYFMD